MMENRSVESKEIPIIQYTSGIIDRIQIVLANQKIDAYE